MSKIIQQTDIKREKGYLYFISKEGDLYKVRMARSRQKLSKEEKERILVAKLGIKKRNGHLYYLDKNGAICEASHILERKNNK